MFKNMKTSADEAKVVLGADFHCFFFGRVFLTKRFSIIEFNCIVNHIRNIKSKPTVNAQWAKASADVELNSDVARNQLAVLIFGKEGFTNAINLLVLEELNSLFGSVFGSAFQQFWTVIPTA